MRKTPVTLAVACLAAVLANGSQHCLDFDDLAIDGVYHCCLTPAFTTTGVDVDTHEFMFQSQWYTAGFTRMMFKNFGTPPVTPYVTNVNLVFDMGDFSSLMGGPAKRVVVDYRDGGGFNNIRVNGYFQRINDFSQIPYGAIFNGVEYRATLNELVLIARSAPEITELWLGGQELELARVCAFTNTGDECFPCDANCDGSVNEFDIVPFVAVLSPDPPPGCSPCAGDANNDGSINQFDIQAFVECLGG